MPEKNPFTLSFSRKPVEYIERIDLTEKILSTFTEDPVTDQLFVITGIRGSGKTVLMSTIANKLEKEKDWYVERCISTRDIIRDLAADLYGRMFEKTEISASVGIPGIGTVNIGGKAHEKTDVTRIREALRAIDEKHKKLLIIIDELANTPQMQEFSSVFQSLVGENLPVYFLGTATPENMDALKNVRFLTFLYRAPRIEMVPLDMASIAYRYKEVFDISDEESRRMAKLTMGYSFAFQVLGYVYWNSRPVTGLSALMPEYDRILAANSYAKIWTEMSEKQRGLCRAMAGCSSHKVHDIRAAAGMDSNSFNGFQNRLLHQGVLLKTGRGTVTFALPRFAEFIRDSAELYEF